MKKRTILLILDNCSSHPKMNLTNIEMLFLPPNTTSILQPLDLGIIKNFKHNYRKSLVNISLDSLELKKELPKINVLEAINMCYSSWQSVTETTIYNCFAKSSLSNQPMQVEIQALDYEDNYEKYDK